MEVGKKITAYLDISIKALENRELGMTITGMLLPYMIEESDE